MLSLGPGSVCDVCLEPFGRDLKGPVSIECGHVFCKDCIERLQRTICPLCRQYFDPSVSVKLHVDMDAMRTSPPPSPTRSASEAENEAKRICEMFINVTVDGATEAHLRQVITDCKNFLASQPRNMYQELRSTHKMVAYLCEIKSSLRAHESLVQNLKSQLEKVETDKAVMQRRIDNMITEHTKENAEFQSQITVLKDECSHAEIRRQITEENYERMMVIWGRGINHYISSLAPPVDERLPGDTLMPPQHSENISKYLISPLAEFTGSLPSSIGAFTALPSVEEERRPTLYPEYPEQQEYQQFANAHFDASNVPQLTFEEYSPSSHGHQFPGETFPRYDPNYEEPSSSSYPNGSKREGRKTRASRSQSMSSPSTLPPPRSSSRAPSRGASRSPSPARPASPLKSSYSSTASHYPTSPSHTSSSRVSLPQDRETDSKRIRQLHELLHSDVVSNSLPNMSSTHFPPSFTRETTLQASVPSRPNTSEPEQRTRPPMLSKNSREPPLAPVVSSINSSVPDTQKVVPQVTASSAALALEKAQREEKERKSKAAGQSTLERMPEIPQERQERRSDKHRSKLEREQQRAVDVEPKRSTHAGATASAAAPSSSSHQRDALVPGVYSSASLSGASLSRRGSANTHSRSAIPPALREQSTTTASSANQRYHSSKAGLSSTAPNNYPFASLHA